MPGVVLRFVGRAIRAVAYGIWRLTRRLARPFARPLRSYVRRLRAKRRRAAAPDTHTPITRPTDEPPDPRLVQLADARLVLTESAEAALAAVRSGVPRASVWLLAVPQERAAAGEPVPWAGELRDTAPLIGGLLADSMDAAGVLERVVGPVRTVVFPPLASERECPECKAEQPAPIDPHPKDVPGHLELWHGLMTAPVEPLPYSYPVARLRGDAGPWTAPKRLPWGGSAAYDQIAEPPQEWTARAQLDGGRNLLSLLPPTETPDVGENGPLRVRVFGFDMKFMRELAEALGEQPGLDVQIDEWPSAGARNNGITENLARSAHTLVAEWARPNAIWLSENKRPDQTLIVRLHRFEIDSYYPKHIKESAVDAVVYIAPLMGRRIRDELGWPVEKLVYVPNYTDIRRLDRPKHPGARFTLGMVSILPAGLKRFDLALDLLAAIRQTDPRFSLLVRSQMGWAHKPSWENPDERRGLQRSMERIEKDPLLRGAVVFDAFGRDMAGWLRKVGHILSLSDVEGSHTSLTEGMASGAVPVLRAWDGAAEAYGEHNLNDSLESAVEQVLSTVDPVVWQARSDQARRDVLERFDPAQVVAAWADLVHGDRDAAQARFGRFVNLDRQIANAGD